MFSRCFIFLSSVILAVLSVNPARAKIELDDDVFVGVGRELRGDFLITDPLVITNRGAIYGTITTGNIPMFKLGVRNSGIIDAVFVLTTPDAILTQYISNVSEMTFLNVRGGTYTPVITVDFAGNIAASGLLKTYAGVDAVQVNKKGLNITLVMAELGDLLSKLKIVGSVILDITDYDGRDLLYDFGDGRVFLVADNNRGGNKGGGDTDIMHIYQIEDGVVMRRRQLSYSVIFGANDRRAAFLDALRQTDPENKILAGLDGAETMDELARRMNGTMFFNPLALNDGLKKMMRRQDRRPGAADSGAFAGMTAVADKANYGSGFGFGFRGLAADFYFGVARENDDRKYGDALVYGAALGWTEGWFAAGAKVLLADWENVLIMTDAGPKTSAKSRLLYTFLDISPPGWIIRPIVRLNYEFEETERHKNAAFYLSYGGRVSVSSKKLGIATSYGLYAVKNPNEIDWGVEIGWRFTMDNAALYCRVGPGNLGLEIRTVF